MSKMTVIQLLNKIANGEDVPKKIRYNNIIYNWDIDGYLHYEDEYHSERAFLEGYRTDMCLNDEVEIIEEDKKIEKLENKIDTTFENYNYSERMRLTEIVNKINEIIDYLEENKND